jgi:oxygen-dependent protoporphyrinogen oxidase
MVGATMATATVTAALPLRLRVPARSRRGQTRCAVASDATEAPAVPSARLSADCVIVGGGISGLCTAQALATKYGVTDLLVTEARARPGGNITTVERPDEGYLWEEGPNSFQPSDPVLTMAVRILLAFSFFSDSWGRTDTIPAWIGCAGRQRPQG